MHRQHREEETRRKGGGLIGERKEKVSGYEHKGWHAVDKMLNGDHPTTNLDTNACGASASYKDGGHVMREQKEMVEGERNHMRRNMEDYDHVKKGGHMRKHFAAGGVGKVRKGQY